MTHTHLIAGVTGQDGVHLARRLVARGDRVIGLGRAATTSPRAESLEGVVLVDTDVCDARAFAGIIRQHRPDVVINLAALSSVGASWREPETTRAINLDAVAGMLDVLSAEHPGARFVQASSAEIYGPPEHDGQLTAEDTPLNPTSPYAEAKAAAHELVVRAREAGAEAANLVLFGHTSALQAGTFVIPKIVREAADIAAGRRDRIELGDPTIRRDWGVADDVARAFVDSLAAPAEDLVIATGTLTALADVVAWALEAVGASGVPVVADADESRPNDFGGRVGDITRAELAIGWRPLIPLRSAIEQMVGAAVGVRKTA